jgi:hypothetical protein
MATSDFGVMITDTPSSPSTCWSAVISSAKSRLLLPLNLGIWQWKVLTIAPQKDIPVRHSFFICCSRFNSHLVVVLASMAIPVGTSLLSPELIRESFNKGTTYLKSRASYIWALRKSKIEAWSIDEWSKHVKYSTISMENGT